MNPERFAQIDAAFNRLEALDDEARRQALEALEDEDRELAEEVRQLLDASSVTWKLGRFGRADESVDLDPQSLPAQAAMPERIGGFRIVDELGRGGMGVVYLGVRDDDDFHQRAAIKVVKRGMDTDEIVDRMRHERRILASLEHPNIARLIDGGTIEDGTIEGGRPFFAMEYIEGRNLLEWAAARRLSLEERIRLFLEICSAVEYAHRNLVIHRDLKPSNILVTETGTAKLLDFGIAKVLATDGDLRTTTGQLLLTPDYASPEQVLGEQLTTASDVYSLGVVLYELLAGLHPYREKVQGLAALYQFAAESTVPRASARVLEMTPKGGLNLRPAQLSRALAGDLDNILGMALRREPERRYPTVAEMAEDLRRHLDLRPVRAHPESLGYRLSRFVRRQRLAVAAAGLIFLSLSAGIAGTSWQAHQANLARQQAEEQAEEARTVNRFLVKTFGEGDPGKHLGNEPTARDLLANGRDQLDTLESQPKVLAALAVVMGEVSQQLGEHKQARELYRRSLEIRRQWLEPPHVDLVESLHFLADAERELGGHDEAETLLLEALEQQRQLPRDPEITAIILNDLGANRHLKGDFEEAVRSLVQALELRRRHLGERHQDTAQTLNNLAVVRLWQEEVESAADLMRQALDITEENLGPEHPESMVGRSNLAATLHKLGKNEQAVDEYEVLIQTQRRVFGGAHHETGQSLNNLGYILLRSGQPEKALGAFNDAITDLSASLGESHTKTLSAVLGFALATVDSGQGEATALESFERFFERVEARQEPPLRLMQAAHARRGRVYAGQGRSEEAIQDLCTALDIRVQAELNPDNEKELEMRQLLTEELAEHPAIAARHPNCAELLASRGG